MGDTQIRLFMKFIHKVFPKLNLRIARFQDKEFKQNFTKITIVNEMKNTRIDAIVCAWVLSS